MKFCPVVPEICRGQERRKRIIIRNGAKTISLPNKEIIYVSIKITILNVDEHQVLANPR